MTTPAVSSHLPAAARKQVKAANDLIASLNAPPGGTPPAGAAPAAAAPNGAAPPLPEVTIVAGATPTPAAAAPPEPTPAEQEAERSRRLEGKLNQTQRENAELRGRIEAAEQTTRALIEAAQRGPAAPAATPAPLKPEDQFRALGVTDQEITDYGAELIGIVSRVARNMSASEITNLKTEVAELKRNMGTVGSVLQKNSEQSVHEALNDAFGDKWDVANKSDEFLAWCNGVDVFSGTRRLDSLQIAFKKGDAARVVAIFKAYFDGNTSSGPPSRQAPVARETLVAPAPGRGSAGEPPGSSDGKVWSEQEITDFYQRARKGKVPKDEYDTTEREIHLAISQGRVRVAKPQHHLNAM